MIYYDQIIHSIFLACRYESYLELGIYDGATFDRVSSASKYSQAVDICDKRINKSSNLFMGTTEEFFVTNKNKFDCIFIDADHRYESAKNDFIKSLDILNKEGTIFIHDTCPQHAHLLQDGYCSDSYKLNEYLSTVSNISFVTLPADIAGLTIIRFKDSLRYKNFL